MRGGSFGRKWRGRGVDGKEARWGLGRDHFRDLAGQGSCIAIVCRVGRGAEAQFLGRRTLGVLEAFLGTMFKIGGASG